MIQRWLDDEEGRLERQVDYLSGQIRALVPAVDGDAFKEVFGVKTKTRNLPHGKVGFRASRATVEVADEAAALDWCRENGVEHGVKEYVKKPPVVKYIQDTGDVDVPGVVFKPSVDEFFVKPAEELNHGQATKAIRSNMEQASPGGAFQVRTSRALYALPATRGRRVVLYLVRYGPDAIPGGPGQGLTPSRAPGDHVRTRGQVRPVRIEKRSGKWRIEPRWARTTRTPRRTRVVLPFSHTTIPRCRPGAGQVRQVPR
jgi:hypothetical protein